MGMSRSACRSGWLGTVMVTCAVFPSLTRGSCARLTMPLLLAVTMVGATVISDHRTFRLLESATWQQAAQSSRTANFPPRPPLFQSPTARLETLLSQTNDRHLLESPTFTHLVATESRAAGLTFTFCTVYPRNDA